VTNASARRGSAIPQLYVADPKSSVPRPPKKLKGFAKISLAPGESKQVTLPLDARAFSLYDTKNKQWRAEAGRFDVLVGESSAVITLKGSLTLPRTVTSAP
jgi:beta-glucosidase